MHNLFRHFAATDLTMLAVLRHFRMSCSGVFNCAYFVLEHQRGISGAGFLLTAIRCARSATLRSMAISKATCASERGVQVERADDPEPPDVLLALGERPVRDQHAAVGARYAGPSGPGSHL
jgi:hypothetical protein